MFLFYFTLFYFLSFIPNDKKVYFLIILFSHFKNNLIEYRIAHEYLTRKKISYDRFHRRLLSLISILVSVLES